MNAFTRSLATVLGFALLLSLSGCYGSFTTPMVFNLDSVNVASLPSNWPDRPDADGYRGLTPAQEEVFDERGRPQFMRARWESRGRLTWGDELRQRYHRHSVEDIMMTSHHGGAGLPFEITWIYRADTQHARRRTRDEVFKGEEIIFISDYDYEIEEVSDKLGTLIDYGDPESRRHPQEWRGHITESWVYYGQGRIFHFTDDILTDVEIIPDMGIRTLPEI